MNVQELIQELESCNKDLEVGYEAGKDCIDLLIGEDPDSPDASSITIPKPEWC